MERENCILIDWLSITSKTMTPEDMMVQLVTVEYMRKHVTQTGLHRTQIVSLSPTSSTFPHASDHSASLTQNISSPSPQGGR